MPISPSFIEIGAKWAHVVTPLRPLFCCFPESEVDRSLAKPPTTTDAAAEGGASGAGDGSGSAAVARSGFTPHISRIRLSFANQGIEKPNPLAK